MNKLSTLFLLVATAWAPMSAQTQMTKEQARTYYTTKYPSRVSVHDPSVVWDADSKQYYIFGSHRAQAKTNNLCDWTTITPVPWATLNESGATRYPMSNQVAFNTPAVKKVKKGGKKVDFPAFNAKEWAAKTKVGYNVDGNLWAPDIIYNPTMKKWCQYLSVNGDKWASSIILLTADKITGPYLYQGPVVISGFNGTNPNNYKDTDLEIVLGPQSSLPARYAKGSQWGRTWPNNIDPCVFYDEQGKLWMSYGSWSGGIFMLELDETTGLRDYDVTYPLTGSGNNYTSDPYFGKKIAGGYYVSGEASYIQHIGDYYYLFMTYGGLEANKGYMMEVFRSKNPDGPYVDPRGVEAIFTRYEMNYGNKGRARGAKPLGAYTDWGLMATGNNGEVSQGHNSAITDAQGRSFLVYHTRFNNGSEGHQVRVHQLFTNQKGWLVAAPFEFSGETTTDATIASQQVFDVSKVTGSYEIMIHRQLLDYAGMEMVRPVTVQLNGDGSVTGAYTGTWELVDGTSYINITVGGSTYQGVVVEQQLEPYTIKALSFTALDNKGVSLWGYKMQDDYHLAYVVNNMMPLREGSVVDKDVNLTAFASKDVTVSWTSSNPDILSNTGVYNPSAMTAESMPVKLSVSIRVGDYEYQDNMTVTVKKSNADIEMGGVAFYPFDGEPLVNNYNTAQHAVLKRNGSAVMPSLTDDADRNSKTLHTGFGAVKNESYVEMPNPLKGMELAEGFTVSFMVKMSAENLWDALLGFRDPAREAKLWITGNTYVGYNSGSGNWIDLNHGTNRTGNIPASKWTMVTLTASRTDGMRIYVNGDQKPFISVDGEQNGSKVSSPSRFRYGEVVDFVRQCSNVYLGYGSFWGSADATYDNLRVYNRVLSEKDIASLYAIETGPRYTTDIETLGMEQVRMYDARIYNLNGQSVGTSTVGLPRGIYIRNGRKFVVK